jgi:hypothetical protein
MTCKSAEKEVVSQENGASLVVWEEEALGIDVET